MLRVDRHFDFLFVVPVCCRDLVTFMIRVPLCQRANLGAYCLNVLDCRREIERSIEEVARLNVTTFTPKFILDCRIIYGHGDMFGDPVAAHLDQWRFCAGGRWNTAARR